MHFEMWAVSESQGARLYTGQASFPLVFFKPSAEAKIGIWNAPEAQEERLRVLESGFKEDATLWTRIKQDLDREWAGLLPYLDHVKPIASAQDLTDYMGWLTRWWVPMSVTYFVPDVPGLATFHEEALVYRRHTEKYAEICDRIVVEFWQKYMPTPYQDLAFFSTIGEAMLLAEDALSEMEIAKIRERTSGYGILHEKAYTLPEFARALQAEGIVLQEDVAEERASQVKGTIAHMGIVKGIARIVIKKADIQKVQPGDVIVAEMTNPDFVPWMKMAAAFVTDEGGMTCHAAIVSREMNKPCVVGTKVATKVFRDGDLVEVDATKGIVKRLQNL